MKKILWLLFLLPIFIGKVYAGDIYYSPYGEYTAFNEERLYSSELVEVSEEVRYKWYKEEKKSKGYEIYNASGSYDLNDCYYDEFTNWSTEKPIEDGKLIETREIYTYKMIKEVRYIHLTNLYGSYDSIRFPEIIVKVNDELIDYKYTCVGCWEGFENTIKDGVLDKNESYISNSGSLIIDLGQVYPADDVELSIYIFDMGASEVRYTLSYSKFNNNLFTPKEFTIDRETFWGQQKINRYTHYIYDLNIPDSLLYNEVITYTPFASNYIRDTRINYEYRYKNKWCMAYNIERQYLEGYQLNGIDEYQNKGDSKTYYRSRQRDKLEIKSPLIIEDYNYDISQLVISSTKDYTVTSNINLNENGIYQVNFKSENINITKDVYVKIDENIIKKYEDIIIDFENQLNEIRNKIIEYENEIDNLNNQIIILEKEYTDCQNNCSNLEHCLQDIIKQKEEYEKQILYLSTINNDLQVQLNKTLEEIDKLILENSNFKVELNEYKKRLIILQNESKISNEKLISNYKQIQSLTEINNLYYEKIKELENQLRNQVLDINKTVSDKDNTILLLEEKIKSLNNLLKENENYENISKEYESEKEQLQSKLNDYVLKIDKSDNKLTFWIYLIISINLLLFALFKMRKKSSVKKD